MSSYNALAYHQREFSADVIGTLELYSEFIPEGFTNEKDFIYAPYWKYEDGTPRDYWSYWMQFVTEPRDSIKYYRGLIQAFSLNIYAIWAMNRFTNHGNAEWSQNIHAFQSLRTRMKNNQNYLMDLMKKVKLN